MKVRFIDDGWVPKFLLNTIYEVKEIEEGTYRIDPGWYDKSCFEVIEDANS